MTNPYDPNYGGGQQPQGYGAPNPAQPSSYGQPSYGGQQGQGQQAQGQPAQGQQAQGQWGQPAAPSYPQQQQSSFGSGGQGEWGQPGDNGQWGQPSDNGQSSFAPPPPAPGAPQWGQQVPPPGGQPAAAYYPVAVPKRRNTALIVRLSILGLVVIIGVVVWAVNRSQQASVNSNGQVTKSGSLGVFSLQTGQCFNDPGPGADVSTVTAIPCNSSHDAQVIGTGTLTEQSADDPAVDTDAKSQCNNFANTAVDQTKVSSSAEIIYFTPDDTSWANGERTLICAVNTGAPVTYSVMSSS